MSVEPWPWGSSCQAGVPGRRESDGWPAAAPPCDDEGDVARAGKI